MTGLLRAKTRLAEISSIELSAASTSSGWILTPPTLIDSAAPAHEIAAIAAPLDDVARVDETVLVRQGGLTFAQETPSAPVRADPQRIVYNFNLNIATVLKPARREPWFAIADGKDDSGFCRGIGVLDRARG